MWKGENKCSVPMWLHVGFAQQEVLAFFLLEQTYWHTHGTFMV
jgi:hypothetical protein